MFRYAVATAVLLIALFVAAVALQVRMNGLSTRTEPTAFERLVARIARQAAVPRRAKQAVNPVSFSAEVWNDARAHFADHCASCHANDGSGDTAVGRNLYPRAPDMRLTATQRLSDGELYWIIENGVRLTGMPAWGAGGDRDMDSWKLVHFVRRLKDLTPSDLEEMKALNPKTDAEREEEREDERFLAGSDAPATPPPTHRH